MRTIPLLRPDAVLNFAAFTNVDGCETDPARATRDNALGAQNVALAARACGAAVLHVSTDYVFDGMKGAPYDEMDATHPLSVYGRDEAGGRRRSSDGWCRSTSSCGRATSTGPATTTRAALSSACARGEAVGGIRDRIGSPTLVGHLASRLLPLLLTGRFGTYHLAGSEPACWFDVLERARSIGGLPGTVEPQEMASLGLVAPRPANSAIASAYLEHIGIEPLPRSGRGRRRVDRVRAGGRGDRLSGR